MTTGVSGRFGNVQNASTGSSTLNNGTVGAGRTDRMRHTKPIKDCEHEDNVEAFCCGHPDAFVKWCNVDACPRLAPFIAAAIEVCRDAYSLADDRTDTAPEPCDDTGLLSLMMGAKSVLDASKGQTE